MRYALTHFRRVQQKQRWHLAGLVLGLGFSSCVGAASHSTRTSSTTSPAVATIAPLSVPFFEMFQLGMPAETARAVAGTFSKRGNWVAGELLTSVKPNELAYRLPLKAIQYRQQRSPVFDGPSTLTLVATGKPRRLTRVELTLYGWAMDQKLGVETLRKYLAALYPWFKAEPAGDSMGFRLVDKSEDVSFKLLYQSERFYAHKGGVPEPTPYLSMILHYRPPQAASQPAAASQPVQPSKDGDDSKSE